MNLVQRLLREPLLHFIAVGALLFLLFGMMSEPVPTQADTIVVGPDQIEQLTAGYQAVWKRAPTNDELRVMIDGFVREEVYYREALALGLEGDVIQVDGLDQTSTDVLVRFDFTDGTSQAHRLTAGDPSFTVPEQPNRLEVARTYFQFGVAHILFGTDHLLFVFALLLLVKGTRRIIATVTAFTLAHSITLAGATLGFVHMPGPPIEAAIALSIAFVAAEIIHSRRGNPC